MIRQSIVLLALVLCGVTAIQPGCRTRFEMRTKWTVQGVSGRFWECQRWGVAVQRSCPTGTLFAQPFQTCVPARSWEEFPYYPPPTTVDDYADECSEEGLVCVNPCEEIPCEGGIVIDGKCETCEGGQWIDGQCICPPEAELVNGICKNIGEVPDCGEFGSWNAEEGYCVCFPGYELDGVEGKCVPGPELIECEENQGTWDMETGECVCPDGYLLVNGRCTNIPLVIDCSESGGNWNWDLQQCECPEGYLLVNGRCTNNPVIIDCEESSGTWNWETGVCECPEGYLLVNGKCTNNPEIIKCVESNGMWDELTQSCICPPGTVLNNGACTSNPEIVDCVETGGQWNDELQECVCPETYHLINGLCVSPLGICHGAPDSAYVRGHLNCDAPACTEEEYWANIHWPTKNPRTFWQCPGIGWVQEMPCGLRTCFSHARQTCVHARDWVNECL